MQNSTVHLPSEGVCRRSVSTFVAMLLLGETNNVSCKIFIFSEKNFYFCCNSGEVIVYYYYIIR